MKRISALIILCLAGLLGASAQPRAIGIRSGITGLDVSYLHDTGKKSFVQTELSVDFGYAGSAAPGFKATALYNFVVARPAWTDKGSWAIYTGPGLSLGYVQDRVNYREGNFRYHPLDYGFMLSIAVQAGLEYTFDFPLQLAADLRPYFGMHVNDGVTRRVDAITDRVEFKSKTSFYNNGWFGFIPSISIRYRF